MAARGDHDPHANAWRTCRFEKCPTCGGYTAIGLDELGLTRRIDPTPLTEHGELQAVASDQQTYLLRARAGEPTRLELSFPRGYTAITGHPAGKAGATYDVVADHRCGLDRDHYQHTASVHDRRHHQLPDDQPPF